MNAIRVLLADMPRMLRDVFKQMVQEQKDMQVVAVLDSLDDPNVLLRTARRKRPHVAIVGLDDSEIPGCCNDLLRQYPNMKVLGVAADGRRALLYELRPHMIPIAEVAPHELLDAIRKAVLS